MCYACSEDAADWRPRMAVERPCGSSLPWDGEMAQAPTRAYLNERTQGTTAPTPERTPGTDIHRLLERFAVGPTMAEVDRAEEEMASRARFMRRLEEYHLQDRERFREAPDPRQRHIVIARSRAMFVRYCDDHALSVRDAIHIRPDDRTGGRHLMGLSNVAIHRVDGAMATEQTESYLRHLVASDRAQDARSQEVERDARNLVTHDADGELRPVYRDRPSGRDYAMPVQGRSSYHYVVDEAGHFMTGQEAETRAEAFSRFYGSGRNVNPERGGEPGANYRPHGEIHTEPEDEDAMDSPHHWASTLKRSPFWVHAYGVLRTAAGDYKPEELDLDIRYV